MCERVADRPGSLLATVVGAPVAVDGVCTLLLFYWFSYLAVWVFTPNVESCESAMQERIQLILSQGEMKHCWTSECYVGCQVDLAPFICSIHFIDCIDFAVGYSVLGNWTGLFIHEMGWVTPNVVNDWLSSCKHIAGKHESSGSSTDPLVVMTNVQQCALNTWLAGVMHIAAKFRQFWHCHVMLSS